MSPQDVTNAITTALSPGGKQFLLPTITAFVPSLWVMAVLLHLARPYVLRTIKKLSLRFGADVWWLSYVLMRDAVLLVTFALMFIYLFPSEDMTLAVPLTAPLAGLFLFASLYVKLLRDTDDDVRAYRMSTVLLAVGAALFLVPQIFGIEVTSQTWMSGVVSFLTSTSNTAWMGPIIVISAVGYVVIASLIFSQVVSGRAMRRQSMLEPVDEEEEEAA